MQVLLATLFQIGTVRMHPAISENNADVFKGIFGGYPKHIVLSYVNFRSQSWNLFLSRRFREEKDEVSRNDLGQLGDG